MKDQKLKNDEVNCASCAHSHPYDSPKIKAFGYDIREKRKTKEIEALQCRIRAPKVFIKPSGTMITAFPEVLADWSCGECEDDNEPDDDEQYETVDF